LFSRSKNGCVPHLDCQIMPLFALAEQSIWRAEDGLRANIHAALQGIPGAVATGISGQSGREE
jgi:hypothetical protein